MALNFLCSQGWLLIHSIPSFPFSWSILCYLTCQKIGFWEFWFHEYSHLPSVEIVIFSFLNFILQVPFCLTAHSSHIYGTLGSLSFINKRLPFCTFLVVNFFIQVQPYFLSHSANFSKYFILVYVKGKPLWAVNIKICEDKEKDSVCLCACIHTSVGTRRCSEFGDILRAEPPSPLFLTVLIPHFGEF